MAKKPVLAIDWEENTALSNGYPERGYNMLKQFIEVLPIAKERIMNTLDDVIELQDSIHKLLGASCYCGVNKLKRDATAAEAALKLKRYTKLPELIETLFLTIDETITVYEAEKDDHAG
ncbi:MAG: hypothetical protein KAT71_06295 [Gammaproteobacteria bacterium]|nr:hypothetical protein [Gammaproteobacteria bacterium]